MRRAAKRDTAEPLIVAALLAVGCSVETVNCPGLPDLLVGKAGQTVLMEVKTGKNSKLTPMQQYFFAMWRGGPAVVVRSVDEALRAVGVTL